MKRPDIQKLIAVLGSASAVLTLHNYYLNVNQPTPRDAMDNCEKGFESVRKAFNETKEFYLNNQQFNNQLKDKLLNSNIQGVDSILNKIRTGQKIDTKTDPDFKALESFINNVKELQNNTSVVYEAGPVTQEQISAHIGKAVDGFNKVKSDPSGSSIANDIDLLNNNNLISEITDYIKAYNEWVSGLEIEQIVYVLNISVLLTVFSLTITLLSIFYSDWLITRFNIEKRFPRIGKFIVLRRKIQNYSFFINSLIIFALIIPAFAVNVHALISSFSN